MTFATAEAKASRGLLTSLRNNQSNQIQLIRTAVHSLECPPDFHPRDRSGIQVIASSLVAMDTGLVSDTHALFEVVDRQKNMGADKTKVLANSAPSIVRSKG
jgi:hypothetical protein